LKDIAEAGGVQGKITAEQAAQAEKLEKEWRKLKMTWSDAATSVTSIVIPGLNALIDVLTKGEKSAKDFGAEFEGAFDVITGQGAQQSGSQADVRRADIAMGLGGTSRSPLDFVHDPKAENARQKAYDEETRRILHLTRVREEAAESWGQTLGEFDRLNMDSYNSAKKAEQDYLDILAKGAMKREQMQDDAEREANEKLRRDLEDQKKLASELGFTFASAFEDAIVKGNSFRTVLEGIYQDILRILVRTQITQPMATWLTGVFAGGMGAAGASAAGARSVTINNEYNIDSRSDRAIIIQEIEAGSRRTEARIADKMERSDPRFRR
jgi:hypothetical protein